ncbi:MAG: hypothetical protein HY695_19025 [Deltaproteobacteria bacterium]|nr:hypothetical protein [Deltaproteobacteria bacterium]
METTDPTGTPTLEELIVSSLATADAVAKLLIEKGVITEPEFTQKLAAEKSVHQQLLRQKIGR